MENKEENKKIVIGEKVLTIKQALKEFSFITLENNPRVWEILSVLMKVDRPLTRSEIAKRVDLSKEYTVRLLNEMVAGEFVAGFRMGTREIYYALTEKGYDFAKSFEAT